MVAPAYELIDNTLIEKWKKYVEEGGHLVLSCRSGMKDVNGHLWESLLQEPIWDLTGARVNYYDHLPPGKKGLVQFEEKKYAWQSWGDILETMENTEPWAWYEDQFYKGATCVTHKPSGNGSVTYLGVWTLDGEMEKQVLRKVYRQAGASILNLTDYVFTEWRDGAWITMNYRSRPVQAPLGPNAQVIFGTEKIAPGGVAVWINK
jgi:beta-galactosidase